MASFHTIRTFHGSILVSKSESGEIVAAQRGKARVVPLYACVLSGSSDHAFLGAGLPTGLRPKLNPLSPVGRIIPVGTTVSTTDGSVAFSCPWTGRFLVVAPNDPSTGEGHAIFATNTPLDYEKLYLDPVEDKLAPPYLAAAAPWLEGLSNPKPTSDLIAHFLANVPPTDTTGEILNAAGLLLSRDELELLGSLVCKSDELIARLRAHFRDDLFAKHALRPLAEWVRERTGGAENEDAPRVSTWGAWLKIFMRAPKPAQAQSLNRREAKIVGTAERISEISPEFDRLDTIGIDGGFASLPFACTVSIRRRVRARKRACVMATARNEGLYLLEWLAHHRAIGFEGAFVYSNDNIDGSDALLRALAEAGEIRWVNNIPGKGTRPQWKAYNHALQINPFILDYEWTLVADLDEYLTLNQHYFSDIQSYLDWAERSAVDVIGFNWVVLGSGGETHWRDSLLRQRFPTRIEASDAGCYSSPLIKSMFRTRKFPVAMPHHPVAFRNEEFSFRSPSMKPFVFDPNEGQGRSLQIDCRLAWVTHYFYKSNEEFSFKFSRARGDDIVSMEHEFSALTADFVRGFVVSSVSGANNSPPPEDRKLSASTEKWLSHFQSLRPVAEAYAEVKKFYRDRLDFLIPKLAASRAIVEAGEAGEAFMRPLLMKSGAKAHRLLH